MPPTVGAESIPPCTVYTSSDRARADADICGVRLYVERTNTGAQATYKKLGMDHSHYDLYETDFTD